MLKNELGLFYSNKPFYVGEEIKGYAQLKLAATTEIQEVRLRFTGSEILILKGKTHIHMFYDQTIMLIGPGSKDHGKDWLGRKKTIIEHVSQGTHRYPFSISLPSILPASYDSPEAKIKYVAEVVVDNGNPKVPNLSSAAVVNIGGSMFDLNFLGNNSNPFETKESKTYMLTKGSFDVSVQLESRVYLPGDPIKVKLSLNNSTSKVFQKISLSLIQKTEYLIAGSLISEKTDTLGTMIVGGLNANENKYPAHQIFIPTTTPETYQPADLPNKKKVGRLLRFSHALVFYAEIGGLFGSEQRFLIPIYIVKRPSKEEEIDPNLLPGKEIEYQQAPTTTATPDFNPEDYQLNTDDIIQENDQQMEQNNQMMNSNPYLQGHEQNIGQNLYPSFESHSNVQDIPLGYQSQQQQQQQQQQFGNYQNTVQYDYPTNDVQYDLPELPMVKKALPPPITDDIIQDQISSNVIDELNTKLKQEKYDEFFN